MNSPDYTKWHLPKGAKLRLGKGYINDITYSPDSSRLAVASSIGIWIYDAETGEELDLFMGRSAPVERLAYSPDGRFIASSSVNTSSSRVNKSVLLWDAETGKQKAILTDVGKDDISFLYSPDGSTIAVRNAKEVRLWDTGTEKHKITITHDGHINNFVYSPDGSTIATGDYTEIKLWDAATGKHKTTLLDTGHHHKFSSFLYSPDGSTIATAGGDLSDRNVWLWDVVTGEHKATLIHAGNNITFVYSPDGSTIATGDEYHRDGAVRLWDVRTGEQKTTLTHAHRVRGFAYSPDGSKITTTTTDLLPGSTGTIAEVCLWDPNTAKLQTIFTEDGSKSVYGSDGSTVTWVNSIGKPVYGWVNSIGKPIYGSDGNTIATVCYIVESESYKGYIGVCLWDAATGKHKAIFTGAGNVACFAYSPDGRTIVTGAEPLSNGTVRLWDAATGKHKATPIGHTRALSSLAYSPDGRTIATRTVFSVNPRSKITSDSTYKQEVWLWDAVTGAHKATLTEAEDIVHCVYSPDGSIIATIDGYGTQIQLWDAATGAHKTTLTVPSYGFSNLSYSPDDSTSAPTKNGYRMRLWNAVTRLLSSPLYSPDGSTIATIIDGSRVQLWDAATGEHKNTLIHTEDVISFVYSPDSSTIATIAGYQVQLWDAATGELKTTLTEHARPIKNLAYSPDGDTIVIEIDDELQLWDVVTAELKTTLTEPTGPIKNFAYSPDSRTIVVESDNKLNLWDAITGKRKTILSHDRNIRNFMYSPDGSTIAIKISGPASQGRLKLWDAATGERKAESISRVMDFACVMDFAYSPDSRILAIFYNYNNVSTEYLEVWDVDFDIGTGEYIGLWDAITGECLKTRHTGLKNLFERNVSFSPEGKTIATGSKDGTVLLWEVPPYLYQYLDINPREIHGNWRAGWALDIHTVSSRPLPSGGYDTERTEFGELVFQLKYRHDRTKIQPIAEIAAKFVEEKFAVDGHFVLPYLAAIIPIPPSDTNRDFQPVTEVAQEIGKLLSVPVRTDYLMKTKQTIPLKNLSDVESKQEQLRGAFAVQSQDLKNRCVLLVDDLYDSGTTLTEATRVLYEQGGVQHVLVLTLTRTRTGGD